MTGGSCGGLDNGRVMALVALGANVAGRWGRPEQTLRRAVAVLDALPGMRVVVASGLWRSAPFGGVAQPPFINAVVRLETALLPHALLATLRDVERAAGRRRGVIWGARALDLDLLDVGGRVMRPVGMGRLQGMAAGGRCMWRWQRKGLVLPHPGIALRAFVLWPLQEVAPGWRHPLLGATASALLGRLPPAVRAQCRPLGARLVA